MGWPVRSRRCGGRTRTGVEGTFRTIICTPPSPRRSLTVEGPAGSGVPGGGTEGPRTPPTPPVGGAGNFRGRLWRSTVGRRTLPSPCLHLSLPTLAGAGPSAHGGPRATPRVPPPAESPGGVEVTTPVAHLPCLVPRPATTGAGRGPLGCCRGGAGRGPPPEARPLPGGPEGGRGARGP